MRIDKWLYYVRLYKTRIESNYACGNGYVLINKLIKNNSSYKISISDIITIVKNHKTIIIKVLKLPEKRISPKIINSTYKLIKQ